MVFLEHYKLVIVKHRFGNYVVIRGGNQVSAEYSSKVVKRTTLFVSIVVDINTTICLLHSILLSLNSSLYMYLSGT